MTDNGARQREKADALAVRAIFGKYCLTKETIFVND
jgi:hypothetical protein